MSLQSLLETLHLPTQPPAKKNIQNFPPKYPTLSRCKCGSSGDQVWGSGTSIPRRVPSKAFPSNQLLHWQPVISEIRSPPFEFIWDDFEDLIIIAVLFGTVCLGYNLLDFFWINDYCNASPFHRWPSKGSSKRYRNVRPARDGAAWERCGTHRTRQLVEVVLSSYEQHLHILFTSLEWLTYFSS